MFIQDLSHLEVVTEASNIEGAGRGGHNPPPPKPPGFALSLGNANAYASGVNFAGSLTNVGTYALSSIGSAEAGSSSGSISAAF